MTYYTAEVQRISKVVYANQRQVDAVIAVKKYIDRHYEGTLSLDHLSKTHFVSKYHLLRLFKKYYGQSPKQYTLSKKIEKARELLKAGGSVTETCFAVGFESMGSFSVLFKNRIGMNPITYRKRQLSRSSGAR